MITFLVVIALIALVASRGGLLVLFALVGGACAIMRYLLGATVWLIAICAFLLVLITGCSHRVSEPQESKPEVCTMYDIPLPERCSVYYADGTGRWAKCMGVGPKGV